MSSIASKTQVLLCFIGFCFCTFAFLLIDYVFCGRIDDYVAETATSDYSTQYKDLGKLISSVKSDVLTKLDGPSAGGGRVDDHSR